MSREAFFSEVYAKCHWSGGGSGSGSSPANSARYRELLDRLLRAVPFGLVVDVGCGDWRVGGLMNYHERPLRYVGLEIVPAVCAKLVETHKHRNVEFRRADVLVDPLPPVNPVVASLLVVKDVMQHWLPEEVQSFLPKMVPFDYALLTNDVATPGAEKSWHSKTRDRYRPCDVRLLGLQAVEVLSQDSPKPNHPRKVTLLLRRGGTEPVPAELAARLAVR